MKSKIEKKMLGLFMFGGMPLIIGFMDWQHLFPTRAHSDFVFQVIGESIELLAVLSVLALMFFGLDKYRERAKATQNNSGMSFIAGTAFSILSIAFYWRDFFPNDHFQFSAGAAGFTGSLVMGLLFGIFSFAFPGGQGKPSKENEKSVV